MRNYIIFLISGLLIVVPAAGVRPMTSLYAEKLDATMIEIGLITACYSVTPFILAIFAGRFIDKYGEKLPLLLGSLSMVIALILPYIFPFLVTLYFSQLLLGGAQLLAIVSIQNGVAGSVPSGKKDHAFANMSLFTSIGLMCGPLIGGYASENLGFRYSFLVFIVFSFASLVAAFFIRPTNQDSKQNQNNHNMGLKKLLSIPSLKLSIYISMINLAALDIFNVYFPLYSSSLGMTPSEIGWVLTISAMASVIIRVFIPTLVANYGRPKLISFFMLSGAVAFIAVPLVNNYFFIIFIAIVIGMGLGITQPLTTIVSYNLAPHGHTGEVLGIRLAGNRLSQIITPIIFAGISNLTGLGAIFIMEALLLGTSAMKARGIQTGDDKPVNVKSKMNSL